MTELPTEPGYYFVSSLKPVGDVKFGILGLDESGKWFYWVPGLNAIQVSAYEVSKFSSLIRAEGKANILEELMSVDNRKEK